MGANRTEQAQLVTPTAIDPAQGVTQLALFDVDGNPVDLTALASLGFTQAENVAAVATANGSDATTTQALANALKVAFNDLVAKLTTANIIAPNED